MSVIKPKNKKICKFFRAKSPYGAVKSGGEAWNELDPLNIASCWCVKTQGPAGPDNGYVDPLLCIEGRRCYKEAVD